jgi:hypothetical protein
MAFSPRQATPPQTQTPKQLHPPPPPSPRPRHSSSPEPHWLSFQSVSLSHQYGHSSSSWPSGSEPTAAFNTVISIGGAYELSWHVAFALSNFKFGLFFVSLFLRASVGSLGYYEDYIRCYTPSLLHPVHNSGGDGASSSHPLPDSIPVMSSYLFSAAR